MRYLIEGLGLTRRQRQVIGLLLGDPRPTNKEIGNCLNIAERTVKLHIKNIMDLTGYRRRTALVNYYRSFNL